MNEVKEKIEIRLLTVSDIRQAMRLKNLAGWNQTPNDWRRLIALGEENCFAALIDKKIVGTTICTIYEKKLAWIGMVLVDPQYRRRGIATELMRKAIEQLEKQKIPTIKLDATPTGRAVYRELDFVEESLIERWSGVAAKNEKTDYKSVTKLTEKNLSDLLAYDCQEFGAERGKLLEMLDKDSLVPALIETDGQNNLCGYGMARTGSRADYLGPIVADNLATAEKLFAEMLVQLAERKIIVDINTEFEESRELLKKYGFSKERELFRMRRGKENSAGTSKKILAIAGPEIG